MFRCKKGLCLLLAAFMAITSLSAAFSAAAEDTAAVTSPLTVQVEMSKSAYFVTAKAKATIRVQNTDAETLRDIAISAFSEKHLLPAGSESGLLIPELEAGQTADYTFEMVLDRKNAGVSFPERVLLFFAQLFRSYKPMQGIPLPDMIDDTVCAQEASFRHGSANSVLQVQVWYKKGTNFSSDPVDPVPRPQVTYLDKYVIEILEDGSYTAQIETKEDGTTTQITMYVDADSRAIEIPISDLLVRNMELPAMFSGIGKLRVIFKNLDTDPKAYLAWTGGYIELEDIQDTAEMIKELNGEDIRQQLQIDKLQYCGITAGVGYVCETYIHPEENLRNDFYFSKTTGYEGIVRWDATDLNTQECTQMHIRLTKGITDKEAFAVSGKKYDPADLERWFV